MSHRERFFLQKPCLLEPKSLAQNFKLPNKGYSISNSIWKAVNNFCVAGIAIDLLCPYVIQACHKQGAEGPYVPPPLQFLANQLTLSQPGGHIMSTALLHAPPDFQTLRRPCVLNSVRWVVKFPHAEFKISSFRNYVKLEIRSLVMSFNSSIIKGSKTQTLPWYSVPGPGMRPIVWIRPMQWLIWFFFSSRFISGH